MILVVAVAMAVMGDDGSGDGRYDAVMVIEKVWERRKKVMVVEVIVMMVMLMLKVEGCGGSGIVLERESYHSSIHVLIHQSINQ